MERGIGTQLHEEQTQQYKEVEQQDACAIIKKALTDSIRLSKPRQNCASKEEKKSNLKVNETIQSKSIINIINDFYALDKELPGEARDSSNDNYSDLESFLVSESEVIVWEQHWWPEWSISTTKENSMQEGS